MKPTELKPKTCRECGDKFMPPNTIRKVCFKYECQVAAAERHHKKVVALREKRERQELRAAKERIKTRSQWLKEAQSVFNRWIKLRDRGLPCVSCGRHHQGQIHAGHFLSVGARPELRFEPLNVWAQCAPCNTYLSGNLILYRKELIQRIGEEKVDWLEGPHPQKHYSIDEIKQLIATYKAKCKELLTREGE